MAVDEPCGCFGKSWPETHHCSDCEVESHTCGPCWLCDRPMRHGDLALTYVIENRIGY